MARPIWKVLDIQMTPSPGRLCWVCYPSDAQLSPLLCLHHQSPQRKRPTSSKSIYTRHGKHKSQRRWKETTPPRPCWHYTDGNQHRDYACRYPIPLLYPVNMFCFYGKWRRRAALQEDLEWRCEESSWGKLFCLFLCTEAKLKCPTIYLDSSAWWERRCRCRRAINQSPMVDYWMWWWVCVG